MADGISNREIAVKKILNESLEFESGTDFGYSNENFELLAAIIEVVSTMVRTLFEIGSSQVVESAK
ncbi:MAG: hypothetical protein AB1757_25355 [Acidobacteriota bacterium]